MKKIVNFLVLILLMIVGPSACGLFQSCPEILPHFQIEGMELNHYRFNDDPYGDLIVPNAKIPWREYGLQTAFKASYITNHKETLGGSALYALSCADDGYLGTKVGIDTLYLVTLADYNDDFAKNDTLNEIISINDWFAGSVFYNLEDYLNDNRKNIQSEYFTIKLNEGPAQDTALEFELIYVLTSGQEFKQKSALVNLRQ